MLCNRNIEEILEEKGEVVTKLKHDDIVELLTEDLIQSTDKTKNNESKS